MKASMVRILISFAQVLNLLQPAQDLAAGLTSVSLGRLHA
jgi:hypothetical protein